MLIFLRIVNFAIVETLELDLSQGMTAFTGETGAGKSIIIDALMLALGERADSSVIRHGEQHCDVTAVFHCEPGSEPAQWLLAHDIEAAEVQIILRRQVHTEGRSKSTINGHPFPLQKVKALSERLVHIHGQHQHQLLMAHQTHRDQLDRYAKHDDLVQAVVGSYQTLQAIQAELEAIANLEQHQDRLRLLTFQADELNQLNLETDEIEKLNQEHHLLHHAKDYLEQAAETVQCLCAEDEPTVSSLLNQAMQGIHRLPAGHTTVKEASELLSSALIYVEEATQTLRQFMTATEVDPNRLEQIEQRLSLLHQMARKYRVELSQLGAYIEQLNGELEKLQNSESQLGLLHQKKQEAVDDYQEKALALRASRQAYQDKICHEIAAIIQQIGMPKGEICLTLTPQSTPQSHGLDKVEYKVRTNPGTPFDLLNKVSSGGELSRISLAIQMITAERGATPTLIFDEVDVGIGGATAALVGQLVHKLGQRLQVLCVTHQPQVAARADHHFVVEKYSDGDKTYSRILPLRQQDRIDEIARMLGGLAVSEQTKLVALELLEGLP